MNSSNQFKVSVPTRVDLAGGTLDIWPLYTFFENATTINATIDKGFLVEFDIRPGPFQLTVRNGKETITLASVDRTFEAPYFLQLPTEILLQFLREQEGAKAFQYQVEITTQIPKKSGLGGSSALCVGLIRGLSYFFNQFIQQGWQWDLLHWVKDFEARSIHMVTGTQDYLAPLFGGLNAFESTFGKINRFDFDEKVCTDLAERALVLFSGDTHESGLSNWEIYKRALEKDQTVLLALGKINEIAHKLKHQLLKPSIDWEFVGYLLREEWEVRKTAFQVSTKRLDEIFSFLKTQPIEGAKVCGAASGGSLLVVTAPDRREQLKRNCEAFGLEVLETQVTQLPVSVHE